MNRKKLLTIILFLVVLTVPLHASAEETPSQVSPEAIASSSIAHYTYSDEEVLVRGSLYYSYLNQFFNNIVLENPNSSEITLTGAIGVCDADYCTQSDFDANVSPKNTSGSGLYIEYIITDQNGESKTCYFYSLLPVDSYITGGLAKTTYTTTIKYFSDGRSVDTLGNGFVKNTFQYRVRVNLSDYAAHGYVTTKTQADAIRAAKVASIQESPSRYYANLEKLLMTRGSNTEINEVIICVKGTYTDEELASISYTDDSKIQYWMDYYTMNLNRERLRVKKAYSVLGDLTVIGHASSYNKMALIANGRDPDYVEIAPGMYRNSSGWTVFRVDLDDYAAKGYVY